MSRQVRWGVLGAADVARKLTIPAICRAQGAELVAIASASGKARELARSFGIPKVWDSYEELLADPEVDAVYIPLPNHLHAEWVIKAALNGKHVLCEKPAALTMAQAEEMIDACRAERVLFMETFMYQYHPQNERVREIIASGKIGDVRLMRSSCSFYLEHREANYRMDAAMGGGSLYDVGCYCIHSIRSVLRSEPIRVFVDADLDPAGQVDMAARGILELENGIKAMFDCSMDMAQHMAYEIVGTKGVISVPRAFRPDLYGGEGLVIVTGDDGTAEEERIYGHEYQLAIEHFSSCLLNGEQPAYPAESTILNMKAIEACRESIRSGNWVELQ